MIHGIINVYKEPGFTSFDVVAKLRGITKQKKIGHTGTLDPAAEGVLPVCFGNGTKLCDMLTDRSKAYRAVMLLGTSTDTLDTTGQVLETKEVTVSEEQVVEAIMSFVGDYDQVPPMYSALKVDGKRLYELARQGKEVERKARPVTIHYIDIQSVDLPYVTFEVGCSKGTYIRSLCQDIGDKLGCGGCMDKLMRVKSGRFDLTTALCLSEIEKYRDENRLSEIVIPLEEVLAEYPAYQVLPEYKKLVDNGNPLMAECIFKKDVAAEKNEEGLEQAEFFYKKETSDDSYENNENGQEQNELDSVTKPGNKIRIYNTEGKFFAVYYWNEEKTVWKPDKIFPIDQE